MPPKCEEHGPAGWLLPQIFWGLECDGELDQVDVLLGLDERKGPYGY